MNSVVSTENIRIKKNAIHNVVLSDTSNSILLGPLCNTLAMVLYCCNLKYSTSVQSSSCTEGHSRVHVIIVHDLVVDAHAVHFALEAAMVIDNSETEKD